MQVARLVEQRGELLELRRGQGIGAERGHRLVRAPPIGGHQLRPGTLLGAELAQAQLALAREPDQESRGAVAQRGALVVELEPPGRHQVHEHHELAGLDREHLADPANALQLAAGEGVEGRVEGLHGDHAGSERGLDLRAGDARRQAARRDLDLG